MANADSVEATGSLTVTGIATAKVDARDRRLKGWVVLVLWCAMAVACIAVILSGRFAAENVGHAFTLLTALISAGAGYQVGRAGK